MPLIRMLVLAVVAVLGTASLAQALPLVSAPPAIIGEAIVGQRLSAGDLAVEEAAIDDVTLTWERSHERGFEAIDDAHEATYVPTAMDVGHRLRVRAEVETAEGSDRAWSEPTPPVAYGSGQTERVLRVGAETGAPARLSQWVVLAGASAHLTGQLAAELATADARLVLAPTVPMYPTVEVPVAIDATGRISAEVEPAVNAVVWLELTPSGEAPQRIRLGLVGVRPRLQVSLGASNDGRDGTGRLLIRDLRLLEGSVVEPGIAGLRLTWEGRLPGDRVGTAVCRSSERITSGSGGRLRGGCRTRGAWSTARWRLVLDPGTLDPGAAPFLPAASAWVAPRVGGNDATKVPNLLRSSATLRPWN